MGVDPELKTKIIHAYEIESEYGWFTGVLLQGKKRARTSNDLAIVLTPVYPHCPLYSKNGRAWNME
jgi:hypothetical protein